MNNGAFVSYELPEKGAESVILDEKGLQEFKFLSVELDILP